jgi:hypothetical protein
LLQTTAHKILRKNLRLKPYQLQVIQKIKALDEHLRSKSAAHICTTNLEQNNFLNHIFFTGEAKFHIPGYVNRHNCITFGSEHPRERSGHERDSSKVNAWCALTRERDIGLFLFDEDIFTSNSFLDMLENDGLQQISRQKQSYSSSGRCACSFSHIDRDCLNVNFEGRRVERGRPIAWPPRSPDLKHLDFLTFGLCERPGVEPESE